VFSNKLLHRRFDKEIGRAPRPIQHHRWTWTEAEFLWREEQLDVYVGASKNFGDAIHFYCQTVRFMLERERIEQTHEFQQRYNLQAYMRLWYTHHAPHEVNSIDAVQFHEMTNRIRTALPTSDTLGRFQWAVILGPPTWDATEILAHFDHCYLRIDLANLA